MTQPRILIAGIGNIFFGDDAFGVEVVRHLAARPIPAGVDVVDFGIRGIDLAYRLMSGYDVAILIDSVQRGGAPGTLYLIEPGQDAESLPSPSMEPHSLDPWRVLGLAQTLGGSVGRLILLGCEPARFDADDGGMELSAAVRAAVDESIPLLDSLVADLCAHGPTVSLAKEAIP